MQISIYNVQDAPIGKGGMGQVYLGHDMRGNKVAIKEMLAQYVLESDLRARFHQEMQILNKLEHPSIVKMYASFEERGNLYLVMEYVEGETIDQYIKRNGPFSEARAVVLLSEVLSALSYVHQKGYVHRDIKPSNIMIRENGKVCLLDFGIAKDMNRKNNGLTVGQLTIGTDGYMSPEQAEGFNIDQRSDIYSLGCVLFYMLTGHHAIQKQASDYATRMSIISNDFPRAKDFAPELSDNLQSVLDKCTSKNMLLRFQSCREFEMELNAGATLVSDKNQNTNYVSIGREGCDIIIQHPRISRHHVDIIKDVSSSGIVYRIVDRSTNGTYVDGRKIHNRETEWVMRRGDTVFPSIKLANEISVDFERIEELFDRKGGVIEEVEDEYEFIYQPGIEPSVNPSQIEYEPKSAVGQLIAVYIFALLGGWLGIVMGASVYLAKVSYVDGRKVYKYKQSHRNAAIGGVGLSIVSMIIWIGFSNL